MIVTEKKSISGNETERTQSRKPQFLSGEKDGKSKVSHTKDNVRGLD